MLALTGFHNWFKSPIHKWLQIVHDRSCDRICKAVDLDKVVSVQIRRTFQGMKEASTGQEVNSCCPCWRAFCTVGASSAGEAQLLRRGSDGLLQPGTQDLAPAGLARLCGGLHLHHPADRRKRPRARKHTTPPPPHPRGGDRISSVSLWRPQNFCSEAVCYSEMMTRKIERSQLGRDYRSFTVQVKPRARRNCGGWGWGGGRQ